ncbi:MAG: nicotinate phosphoribosyltransferase [Parcubacteria group bacterium]|nr:nicotinate phosphoribosyltransferase [Parcubacteria group bacterium]
MNLRLEYFETADQELALRRESLADIDFYKYTMGQWILENGLGGTEVTFELIVRDPNIKLAQVIPENELREALDRKRDLRHLPVEIKFLRDMQADGKNVFGERYLQFLERFQLPPYELKREGDQYHLTFTGKWIEVTMWETIALAVISELYYTKLGEGHLTTDEYVAMLKKASDKLYRKLDRIAQYPGIRFSDFCQRRRNSFMWQKFAVGVAKSALPKQFIGTSNTWMAMHHNVPVVGTMAHEIFMVLAALARSGGDLRDSQYRVLARWMELYGPKFRVFLADTYRTPEFLKHAPAWIAHHYSGMRLDSGNLAHNGHLYIDWLKGHGVDPMERFVVPSDGLDDEDMIRLHLEFQDKIDHFFGWGTLFGNDFRDCAPPSLIGFRPFSVVCKVTRVAGRHAVKLSDNRGKETGPKIEVDRYKGTFGIQDVNTQPIV